MAVGMVGGASGGIGESWGEAMRQRSAMQQFNYRAWSEQMAAAQNQQQQKGKQNMGTSYIKDYFVKHRELLMGFTIFVLLDHFVFGGAFREKIQRIVHSVLDKAESKLTSLEGEKKAA